MLHNFDGALIELSLNLNFGELACTIESFYLLNWLVSPCIGLFYISFNNPFCCFLCQELAYLLALPQLWISLEFYCGCEYFIIPTCYCYCKEILWTSCIALVLCKSYLTFIDQDFLLDFIHRQSYHPQENDHFALNYSWTLIVSIFCFAAKACCSSAWLRREC